ncbi:MAG: hypothetical protein F4Y03_18925, partial [Alphaproteobacteria bacterium]|nr:hypothetical protein [Alphaproteobacteria bacterium]
MTGEYRLPRTCFVDNSSECVGRHSSMSMLAARLPGVLPPLQPAEALEVSRIHSAAGALEAGRIPR